MRNKLPHQLNRVWLPVIYLVMMSLFFNVIGPLYFNKYNTTRKYWNLEQWCIMHIVIAYSRSENKIYKTMLWICARDELFTRTFSPFYLISYWAWGNQTVSRDAIMFQLLLTVLSLDKLLSTYKQGHHLPASCPCALSLLKKYLWSNPFSNLTSDHAAVSSYTRITFHLLNSLGHSRKRLVSTGSGMLLVQLQMHKW